MRGFNYSLSMVAAAAAVLCSFSASAALVDKGDLAALKVDAKKKGATSVVVHLEAVSLSEMSADISGVNARMSAKASQLLAELGSTAWVAGRWENGIGQLGLNVTEAGLKILQNSSNAVHFYPGQAWHERTALAGDDGRFAEIERQLAAQGFVEVQVVLHAEGMEFDFGKDGSVKFSGSDRSSASAVRSARSLFGQMNNAEASGKESAASRFEAMAGQVGVQVNPEFTLRVNREGLEKLASSKDVRGIKPVRFVDKRKKSFDDDAIVAAERSGTAEVVITVRNPVAGGPVSKASLEADSRSNKRTMDAVLAGAGVAATMEDISVFGAAFGRLSVAELKALRASADPRLLSVELNKPIATVQLRTSTVSANFPPAWAANFRGSGQNIVVVDTGVQSNHRFFQGANGLSKVVFEACFGTNTQAPATPGGPLVTWQSNCPSQVGTTGDSPLGLAGSAAPRLNCAGNSSPLASACHHGTHVAGIAAGRNSPTFVAGFQGVANEANIVAVQAFSFDAARVADPTVFRADLVATMQAIASAMTQGSLLNPYTVNLSIGGAAAFAGACPNESTAFTTAVQTLFNAGVPVIASTGNGSARGAISFPACVPRVVKVGAVENNAAGTTIAAFSNLAKPVNFPGDFFWMAPGGGGATNVVSATNSTATVNGWTQSTGGVSGTSQAAPHVSGLYALVKAAAPGISVNDVSNWIQANASQPLAPLSLCTMGPCSASDTVTFRRIRLPNF